jgi:hypothetical protein
VGCLRPSNKQDAAVANYFQGGILVRKLDGICKQSVNSTTAVEETVFSLTLPLLTYQETDLSV